MKWTELPKDLATLKDMYERLKDKEMRLEADLAIKEHPDVEESITRLALALADVKKLDTAISKVETPESLETRTQMNALVTRAVYLRNQLNVVEQQIKEFGGKAAEKLVALRQDRDSSFEQLRRVYESAKAVFGEFKLDLAKVVPSIADFIVQPELIKVESPRDGVKLSP